MKTFTLSLIAAFAINASSFAVNPTSEGNEFNKKAFAEQRTEQMVNRYGLTKKQAKQVYEINEKLAYIIAENQPTAPRHKPDNRHGMNIMQRATIAYDLALQKIMNFQQYNDYIADKNAMQPQSHARHARQHAPMTAHTPLQVRAGRH